MLHIVTFTSKGSGGILQNNYVTADTQFENLKNSLGFLVRYKIMRMKLMDQISLSILLKMSLKDSYVIYM